MNSATDLSLGRGDRPLSTSLLSLQGKGSTNFVHTPLSLAFSLRVIPGDCIIYWAFLWVNAATGAGLLSLH